VYIARKHGRLADWAITELVALLNSLSLFLLSTAESQFLRNMFYSHYAWTTHLDCCTAVLCSPRTWSGLLYGGRYYKIASRLSKVILRVCPSLRSETGRDRTCSKYRIAVLPIGSSTQPANSNRLNTQCSTLLTAALIWRDSTSILMRV